MDRQNPLLKDKYNDHHPAVLRMIRMVVEAAHQENRQAGICGEIAADTELTETFLRMGVDFLSVVPACILPVRKAIRATDLEMRVTMNKKSKVILLPCNSYREELVYENLELGLELLGGIEGIIDKE